MHRTHVALKDLTPGMEADLMYSTPYERYNHYQVSYGRLGNKLMLTIHPISLGKVQSARLGLWTNPGTTAPV